MKTMETCEQMTCFEWCFTNRPELHNYTYCETVEECCREIDRRYSCLESDYSQETDPHCKAEERYEVLQRGSVRRRYPHAEKGESCR